MYYSTYQIKYHLYKKKYMISCWMISGFGMLIPRTKKLLRCQKLC